MNIEKKQIDDLNIEVTLNIAAEDYAPIKKKKLNERRRTAEFNRCNIRFCKRQNHIFKRKHSFSKTSFRQMATGNSKTNRFRQSTDCRQTRRQDYCSNKSIVA